MAQPISFISQTYLDYSEETSHVELPVTGISAANFVAENALIGTLFGAIANTTLGNPIKQSVIASRDILGVTPPTDVNAQRETKWLVRYHDNTTFEKFKFEIPNADLSFLAANSDFMDKTSSAYTSLKAAFEAVVVSPSDATHTVTMDSVQHVGRNL